MAAAIETRYLPGLEVRADGNGSVIAGYAAIFNTESQDLGGFVEQIDPGAFTKTLQEADVRALGNHDPSFLLGRSKARTLRLTIDRTGLRYEVDVNKADPAGQSALARVERGDWDGSSFSFMTIRDQWNFNTDPAGRRLLEVALIDVGPVTFPAYLDTTANARAALDAASRAARATPGELLAGARAARLRELALEPSEEWQLELARRELDLYTPGLVTTCAHRRASTAATRRASLSAPCSSRLSGRWAHGEPAQAIDRGRPPVTRRRRESHPVRAFIVDGLSALLPTFQHSRIGLRPAAATIATAARTSARWAAALAGAGRLFARKVVPPSKVHNSSEAQ